jgi:hypothetical protein
MKFLIIDCPSEDTLPVYLDILQQHEVCDLVRVCQPTYNKDRVIERGIQLHDWPFEVRVSSLSSLLIPFPLWLSPMILSSASLPFIRALSPLLLPVSPRLGSPLAFSPLACSPLLLRLLPQITSRADTQLSTD